MKNDEITALLIKAKRSINSAKKLFEDGNTDFSASRTYYSMFYLVEALLLTKKLKYSKHFAVISAFGREFIKTGIFPQKFHFYIIAAFDLRNAGDYDAMNMITTRLLKNDFRFVVTTCLSFN
jgi:uncharacterized protein (UPF0332 family)